MDEKQGMTSYCSSELGTYPFEKLRVWHSGIRVLKLVYKLTENFPSEEKYALTSQIRRAAISIPSNIAEGVGRGKGQSNLYFARIARGSLFELRTLLILAKELGHEASTLNEAMCEIEQLRPALQGYISSLERRLSEVRTGYESTIDNFELFESVELEPEYSRT